MQIRVAISIAMVAFITTAIFIQAKLMCEDISCKENVIKIVNCLTE